MHTLAALRQGIEDALSSKGMKARSDLKLIWMWRAWTPNRSRIADSGMAMADTEQEATAIAWQCLGGLHAHRVETMQVELMAFGVMARKA